LFSIAVVVPMRSECPIMQPSPKNWPGSRIPMTASLLGQNSELDLACLKVKHGVRNVTLYEHCLILLEFQYRFSRSDFCEKQFGIERFLSHENLLVPDEDDQS